MNKYAAVGLAAEAREGRLILVITANSAEAAHAIDLFADEGYGVKRVRRTNGAQEIEYHGGGRIIFRSYRSSGHRGVAADTVFLDAGVDQVITMDDKMPLVACLATSPHGALIRA